jgi:hypothetical protein
MTYANGEPPTYTPPQDPWSTGVSAPPTDPIPAPPRGQYAQGIASPSTPTPNAWAQETVAQGRDDRPRGSGRGGVYLLIGLLVLVLGGAGGVGAWYLTKQRLGTQTVPDAVGTTAITPTSGAFDPASIRVGDCLFNRTPDQNTPDMSVVPCGTGGSMPVLKIVQGDTIPQTPDGKFSQASADAVCNGVHGWYGSWFGWNNYVNNNFDYFYCLGLAS